MTILEKFAPLADARKALHNLGVDPFAVGFDRISSPVEAEIDGRPVLILGSNNYLGLTFEPDIVEEGVAALRAYGTGTTGSRIANGTFAGHRTLERRIADAFGRKHAMVFSTGYQANLGMLATLVGPGDTVFIDADSHASIYDGCRMATGQVIRFRHNDADDLAKRIRRLGDTPGAKLIVVEGIYSMLGDRAPMAEIAAVKRESDAALLVDEAHSFGVLGPNGRGAAEEAGVEADVDFVVGTFSKSLGAVGGYCASDIDGFDVLRVACRPYMFTASLPPSVIATVLAALDRQQRAPELRETLAANAERLYSGLAKAGFSLGSSVSPIVAVRLPDVPTATRFWADLLAEGVYVNLALPPATPTAEPLLRTSVTAAHDSAQIDRAVAAIVAVGERLGVIGGAAK
ncbi:8-amino-7-oxononanoate synthase [uncultured Alphaproteobacteria bacterium]|uniref:8-amino-7-oxononanoate synthase n=1 Tax=uncultured Alphaproteobacteria bacterium TaxID=91750 RepID=A0A212K7Y7_9PROT|nr:8-amino-7-oxononanoate synthase [uncultured Alphaproteobacteria bacterium]